MQRVIFTGFVRDKWADTNRECFMKLDNYTVYEKSQDKRAVVGYVESLGMESGLRLQWYIYWMIIKTIKRGNSVMTTIPHSFNLYIYKSA